MAEQKETFGQKLAKLLLAFEAPTAAPPIEQKFLDLPLADGTTLKIAGETLSEGAAVTMPDGTPAPDGDYALADGTVITVGGGVITAIKAQAPQEEPLADQNKAAIDELKSQLTAVLTQFNAQKTETDSLKTEIESYKIKFSAQTDAMKELIGIVQEIADEPKAPPVELKKNMFGAEKKSKLTRFDEFAEGLKKLTVTAQA